MRTVTQFVILKKKRFLNSFEKRIFEGHGLCFLWWSPWTSKKTQKCWWWNENILIWQMDIVYEKNKNLFHIRLQLIIWDMCFCFLLILMILQILNFFVKKKMPNIVHTYVVKLLLHLLKEKIDLVFDPPWPIQIFK